MQLAYDTSNNLAGTTVDITTCTANVFNVNLFGDFSGFSQGTLVTHGSTNPITSLENDIAFVFGSEAGKYITDKFGQRDTIQTRSITLASGVGNAVVKWGANKILGALTAGFSKPTSTITDLSFTTQTKGSMTGSIGFEGEAPATSFRPNFSTTDLGCHLGAWNLAETPTVYVDPRADMLKEMYDSKEFYYKLRGITGYKYDLVINPDLEKHIVDRWVVIEPIRYGEKPEGLLKKPIKKFDYGSLGTTEYATDFSDRFLDDEQKCLYEERDGYNVNMRIYADDMKSVVYMRRGLYDHYGQKVPRTIFVPKEYYIYGRQSRI